STEFERMIASRPAHVVAELNAILPRALLDAEVAAVLQRREAQLVAVLDEGRDPIDEVVFVKDEVVEQSGREGVRPVVDERLIVVERLLAVVSRADGTPQAATIDIVFALQRVPKSHPIGGRRLPIAASGEQCIAQRRWREACQDAPLVEGAHAR